MTNETDTSATEFAPWLTKQSGGRTERELTETLAELVRAIKDTGKKGSLNLLIEIAPMKGDPDVLMVVDKITRKLPEHDRKASLYWADDDGNLVGSDPNQPSLWEQIEGDKKVNTTGEVDD